VVVERLAGQVVLMVVAAAVLVAHPSVPAALYDLVRTHLPPPVGPAAAVHGGTGVINRTGGIGFVMIVVIGLIVTTAAVLIARSRIPRRPRLRPGLWAAVGALSGAALLGYLTMFVIAARAAGSHAAVADLLPVLVLALLAMGLPISVGGWGPREAVTTAVFAAVGLGAAQGLMVAVVYGALSFVACLPGAGVLLVGLIRPARKSVTGDGVTTC
jgi:uncharacterized membrane protein YbhN (UPF0104 family)